MQNLNFERWNPDSKMLKKFEKEETFLRAAFRAGYEVCRDDMEILRKENLRLIETLKEINQTLKRIENES